MTCRSPSLRAAPSPWFSVCTTRTRGSRAAYDSAIAPGLVGRAVVDDHDLEPVLPSVSTGRAPSRGMSGRYAATSYAGTTTLEQRRLDACVNMGADAAADRLAPRDASPGVEPDRPDDVPPQGAVRRRRRPQRHQHDGRADADPGAARAPARGRRRRDQPQGLRRAALGGRPPRPAAQGGAGPGQRRAAGGVVRDRPGRHPRARADPRPPSGWSATSQVSPELVVKDPRLGWFLGLWRVAAVRTGADAGLRDDAARRRPRWSAASRPTTPTGSARRTWPRAG